MIFGRLAAAAAGVALVSACGGTTTTYAPNVYPALVGQAVVDKAPYSTSRTAEIIGTSNVDHSPVTVTFIDLNTVDVSINNGATVRLNFDGTKYTDNAGTDMTFSLADLGGSTSQQMLSFKLSRAGSPNIDDYFIGGNRTLVRDLPQSGTADYTGRVVTYDGNGVNSPNGTITLQANFDTNRISGSMTNVLAAAPSAVFSFSNSAISSGAFTNYAFTLSGATAISGKPTGIEGAFYGPGGAQVGGVVRIHTTAGSVGGVFAGLQN